MDSRKNVIKNVALKARKGYTKFMYKDSTARDEYLGAIDEKIVVNNSAIEEDTESESKPRCSFFDRFKIVDEEEESNELELILVDQFRDKDLKPYTKELKGRDLLKRDFESTPLYIETHGDFLKVTGAETVDSNHAGCVTIVISTYREDFLVDFQMDF